MIPYLFSLSILYMSKYKTLFFPMIKMILGYYILIYKWGRGGEAEWCVVCVCVLCVTIDKMVT